MSFLDKTIGIIRCAGAIDSYLTAVENELKTSYNMTLQLKVLEIDMTKLIDAIAQLVSDELGVTMYEILSKNRDGAISEARFIISSLCLEYIPKCKQIDMASYFNQHHSSIIHGLQKTKDLLSVADPSYTAKYHKCKQSLQAKLDKYQTN